jgi:hypothetical protein
MFLTKSQSCSKKSPAPFSMPNSFGSWPTMTVSASPMMNPFRTGSEMKFAMNPNRKTDATIASSPTVIPSVAVSWTKSLEPWVTRSRTIAADSAADAAPGPVTSWRELPNAAYRIRAPGAAYKPMTGETPAIDAYASASGTSTAHMVRPAIRSPGSLGSESDRKTGSFIGTPYSLVDEGHDGSSNEVQTERPNCARGRFARSGAVP